MMEIQTNIQQVVTGTGRWKMTGNGHDRIRIENRQV
jgi:hypothetical protein